VLKGGPMLGNMGPRKEWIWENIHSLCNKLNNEMQEKSLLTHRVGSGKLFTALENGMKNFCMQLKILDLSCRRNDVIQAVRIFYASFMYSSASFLTGREVFFRSAGKISFFGRVSMRKKYLAYGYIT
jgi:hypothetical protein